MTDDARIPPQLTEESREAMAMVEAAIARPPELRPPDLENLVIDGEYMSDEEAGRAHLSNSAITTLLSCSRRRHYEYDRRLTVVDRPLPFSMGSAFHHAIEAGDPAEGVAYYYADRPPPRDQPENDRQSADATIVRAASAGYLARYGDFDPITREFKYRIRLRSPYTGYPSRTFDLMGAADGVIDHGEYLEVIEDKFVGQISAASVKKTKMDRQVGLEAYALWRVTGKPVRIIRYRHTRKPSIKQKKGETIEEFCDRVAGDYEERPDFYFHEEQTFRDEGNLLELEQELWEWAEMVRQQESRGVFPRNTSACETNRGVCPFLPLCAGDPDAIHLYQVKPHYNPKENAA